MVTRRYWRISYGSQWLPLDDTSAKWVDYLWSRNQSGYIQSSTFQGPVYIDFDNNMALLHNNISYTIAYR